MKEIEIKILDIDPKEIVAKLKELGADKIESGIVKVTAFDFPDDRLLKEGSYVRVRTFGHRTELVLKKKIERGEMKVMEEIETNVEDYDVTVKLFSTLGMKVFAKHDKYRATYKIDNIKFELDKYPAMPWLIEVEAPTVEDVKKGVKMLGYDMSQTTSRGTRDIFKDYGVETFMFSFKEKGESPDYDSLFE